MALGICTILDATGNVCFFVGILFGVYNIFNNIYNLIMSKPKDFFDNLLCVGDVVLYSTGTKPHEQGFAYGVIDCCKEVCPDWWACYITPIKNGKTIDQSRYRAAANVLKCPQEHIPNFVVSVHDKN